MAQSVQYSRASRAPRRDRDHWRRGLHRAVGPIADRRRGGGTVCAFSATRSTSPHPSRSNSMSQVDLNRPVGELVAEYPAWSRVFEEL
ncbi:MAG: hypothetical protein ABI614_11750, partial [Planctomycetota bacterium]